MILVSAALLVFAYQLFQWFTNGAFPNISLLTVLSYIPYTYIKDWVYHPDQWVMLHQILGFIPLAAFLFLAGLGLFIKKL